ncbi:hypothetical protein M2451_001173 [Dysgonomonas sp. PFB1-18]|uniref:hypothetical protein n=1 Tax=unclassified Dysgonomonas TaxID=2630389 RepID=UPI002474551C|nr:MULTISPECIES: hypothetical protein [unclassified Dysgonomonas]MDL2302954.1 hypothetical protein [Dysgonomonas sp. OttesenSCG-928-D17]MDH6308202.1 hypothetical protein [Dysgonomonas sp. PF1-14]MDH6338359.1 hypothetical protein [Dysgonomonas sp. PF1-16]MDH6379856.1 hypothetical protein [Dysgonomonas sp. PFB1-18]MDH6397054.1 hypothetical protein [Dysgonomonas sp. PF1-23]
MFIIFSAKSFVSNPLSTSINCPNCGAKHSIEVILRQEYVCFFWIPSVPQQKEFIPVCNNCAKVFSNKEIPVGKEIRDSIKSPRWMWTGTFVGIALIFTLLGYIAIDNKNKEKATKEYITAPKVNDIYEYGADKSYSLMKVMNVTDDSVYFYLHSHQTDSEYSLRQLKEDGYENSFIDTLIYGFSKEELLEQFNDKLILNVERKK